MFLSIKCFYLLHKLYLDFTHIFKLKQVFDTQTLSTLLSNEGSFFIFYFFHLTYQIS